MALDDNGRRYCYWLCFGSLEIGKIVRQFEVGRILKTHDPEQIAVFIKEFINDKNAMEIYKANCLKAMNELNWDKQKNVLDEIYSELI